MKIERRKHWLIKLWILLFTVSVSVSVIPGGIVNVRGLFGEVKDSVALQEQDDESTEIAVKKERENKHVKGINIYNEWYELCAEIVCISFGAHVIRLPKYENIVTLKVRMNN